MPQPAMLRAINAMPAPKAIALALGFTFAGSGTLMTMHLKTMTPIRTINKEWEAATEQYMRFYNMNPIHGNIFYDFVCDCSS